MTRQHGCGERRNKQWEVGPETTVYEGMDVVCTRINITSVDLYCLFPIFYLTKQTVVEGAGEEDSRPLKLNKKLTLDKEIQRIWLTKV